MTAANFNLLARRWLYTTLATDETILDTVAEVNEFPSPQDATYPVLTWSTDSPFKGSYGNSEETLHATGTMLVRVVDKTGSYESLDVVVSRIIELLDNVNNAHINGGGVVLTSRWLRSYDLPSLYDGVEYRALGAIFRIRIQAS